MALVTYGFDVDLQKLAIAYATASETGDASSLPQEGLRERALEMRSYYRWGRRLYNDLQSGTVAWKSLEPRAKEAWRWYYRQGCVCLRTIDLSIWAPDRFLSNPPSLKSHKSYTTY